MIFSPQSSLSSKSAPSGRQQEARRLLPYQGQEEEEDFPVPYQVLALHPPLPPLVHSEAPFSLFLNFFACLSLLITVTLNLLTLLVSMYTQNQFKYTLDLYNLQKWSICNSSET